MPPALARSFKNYIHPLAASQVVLPDHYEAFRAKLEAEKAAALKEKQEKEKAEAAAAAAAAAEAKAKAEAEAAAVKAEGDGAEEAPPGAEEPAVKAEGGEGEAEVKAEAEANGDQPMADVKQEGGEQAKEGEEAKAEGEGQVKKEEEEQQQAVTVGDDEIKVLWVRQQDELYDRTKAELLKRKPFEDAVRRPYFHVKPLDGVQLWNWIRYLDATEAGGDHAAIVTLFERCLVACANYPGGARKRSRCKSSSSSNGQTSISFGFKMGSIATICWPYGLCKVGASCSLYCSCAPCFLGHRPCSPPAGRTTLVAAEGNAATNRLGRG